MGTLSSAGALFGQTRQRVLAAFFVVPDRAMHVREVVRLVGTGSGPVQRELATLAGAGLLVREEQGNQVRYRANTAHPVFPELRGLIMKTVGLADPLRKALEPLAASIAVAFVFGSVAKGAEGSASDVDLLIVGEDLTLGQVARALRPAQQTLGREVTPVAYTREDVRARIAAKNPFLTRVLAEPKLYVIGGEDELGAVADSRWLVVVPATAERVKALLGLAARDLASARAKGLADDWRLAITYNAGLQLSLAALAAEGYEPVKERHHERAIGSLAFTVRWPADDIDALDTIRRRRNTVAYEEADTASSGEADDALELVVGLEKDVGAWLRKNHPNLS